LEQVETEKRKKKTNKTPKKEQRENRNEELENISIGIERGSIAITRLNEAEERGRSAGGRRNVEASILAGAKDKTSGRDGAQSIFVGWDDHKQAVKPQMGKGKLERFTLAAIADALNGSDVATARENLSQLVNSAVEVSGTVQKRVKRDGQCKLVIEPGDVPGFVVFADCLKDAETVTNSKIRKGSSVRVKGKFQTFGASAVCLSDCRLVMR
jgi:hypothetical protein